MKRIFVRCEGAFCGLTFYVYEAHNVDGLWEQACNELANFYKRDLFRTEERRKGEDCGFPLLLFSSVRNNFNATLLAI